MAVTQKKNDELYSNQQQNTQYPTQGYQGLSGVSDQTAQKVQNAQQGYQPTQAAQQAQQQLQQVQAQKPQGYTSKYGPQLDSILEQIQNPKEIKYSFDGDEMFKYYADLYSQNGRQASMDAMGQAAALTGGYGNSYAQQVGNQAYDEWMRSLYDRGMDLYDRAYQRHRDALGDQKDAYAMMSQQDQIDYGRNRDEMGDWEKEREYWTGRADTLDEREYNRYMNDLDYYTDLAQAENADYWTGQQMQENIRQFNESLDWDKMSTEQKYAAEYAMAILQNGQMPSAELLQKAGLSAEDAAKLMAQVQASGGGPGPKTTTPTLTPEEMTQANWKSFLTQYWDNDAKEREELRQKAEEENKKKAAANNKKTGAMTGVQKYNHTTKTTK